MTPRDAKTQKRSSVGSRAKKDRWPRTMNARLGPTVSNVGTRQPNWDFRISPGSKAALILGEIKGLLAAPRIVSQPDKINVKQVRAATQEFLKQQDRKIQSAYANAAPRSFQTLPDTESPAMKRRPPTST